MTALNLGWFALQVLIVTGPAATATLYVVARQIAHHEIVTLREVLHSLRRMLAPAWQWGALNLLVVGAVVGNFWFYQNAQGFAWIVLRLLWGMIALVWFALNLFYWPFWLAQSERRMRTTLRNCFVLLFKEPALALSITCASALLIVGSVLVTLPLTVALMAWLALLGVLTVDETLNDEIATASRQSDPAA